MKKLFIALTLLLYAGGLNAQTFNFSCIDYSSIEGYDLSISLEEVTGPPMHIILQANLNGKGLEAVETLFISNNLIESYFDDWTITWSLNGESIDDGDGDAFDHTLIITDPEVGTYQITVTDDYGVSRSVSFEYTIQQIFMESDAGDKNSDGDTLDTGVFFDGVSDHYQVITDINIDVNGLDLTQEWQNFAIDYDRDLNLVLTTNNPLAQVELQINSGGWTTIGDITTVGDGYSFSLTATQLAAYGSSNFNFKVYDEEGTSIDNSDIFFKINVQTEAEFVAENPEPEDPNAYNAEFAPGITELGTWGWKQTSNGYQFKLGFHASNWDENTNWVVTPANVFGSGAGGSLSDYSVSTFTVHSDGSLRFTINVPSDVNLSPSWKIRATVLGSNDDAHVVKSTTVNTN